MSAFQGVRNLIGEDKLKVLANKNFLIVGIGGVGSWIAEFLIRSGAYHITLVDLDEICVSNINRQIHSNPKTIGKSKVLTMKERLLEINPDAQINIIEDFLTATTIDDIINSEVSFVFDAIDSVKNKCLIIQKCKRLNIPFVVIGAAAQRVDPSKIILRDLNKSINDRLLFQVKKKLKKDYGYSKNSKRSYRAPAVYSTEVPLPQLNIEEGCEYKSGRISNCESGLGSVGFVTSAFASVAVSFAFRKICEIADD